MVGIKNNTKGCLVFVLIAGMGVRSVKASSAKKRQKKHSKKT